MNLKSFSPFNRRHIQRRKNDPLELMRREFHHLLDHNPFQDRGMAGVKVDMREDKSGITVSAELPGVAEEDLSITLEKDFVTIKGEKKCEKEEKGESYYMSERSFGSFSRTIRLPYDVDASKVVAEFDEGVLTLKIPAPKNRSASGKSIKIKKKK